MQKIICAKVRAWYAGAVAVVVGCLTSVFSCRAIMEGAADGWRVVAKATMLAAYIAAYLMLVAFTLVAMRNKGNIWPYIAAMLFVGAATFVEKFFYVV